MATDRDTHMAIQELIDKQHQAGTVDDWIAGYTNELEEVTKRRLRVLSQEEIDQNRVRQKAVRLRMNLEPKRDGRKKCRLILQGFREPKAWDHGMTDSPVAALSSIRSLIFMDGHDGDIISSVDINTAFLQSVPYDPTDEPRYVYYQPHQHAPRQYYQLMGSIYGQRSASLAFYKTLTQWLMSEGYTQGCNEPCLFVKGDLKVLLYVDGILCRGPKADTDAFYDALSKRFDIKDPSYLIEGMRLGFVGFDICMNHNDKGEVVYSMDQSEVITSFLNDHEVPYSTMVKCPMPDSKMLHDDDALLDDAQANRYRSIIGSLNYYAVSTRYDIAHAVSRLSQYSNSPTKSANRALHRVLLYLRSNSTLKLEGGKGRGNRLSIYQG